MEFYNHSLGILSLERSLGTSARKRDLVERT
jgi:hypothetical protein